METSTSWWKTIEGEIAELQGLTVVWNRIGRRHWGFARDFPRCQLGEFVRTFLVEQATWNHRVGFCPDCSQWCFKHSDWKICWRDPLCFERVSTASFVSNENKRLHYIPRTSICIAWSTGEIFWKIKTARKFNNSATWNLILLYCYRNNQANILVNIDSWWTTTSERKFGTDSTIQSAVLVTTLHLQTVTSGTRHLLASHCW